jgi:tRNA threonylcarbamoyladenosine biosynthesis protein TsaB
MIVLGLDTATPSTAVGLRLADGRTLEARDDPAAGAHPGHATRLLGMANDLLATAEIRWEAIDRVAVGVGPGTFTGLRVGIATARGLAQSLSAELVGVSSLRALAVRALAPVSRRAEEHGKLDGDRAGAVLAAIDARRGEAFVAAYEGRDGEWPAGELFPARALAPEDLAGVPAAAAEAGYATQGGWLAVGDGAVRFRLELEQLGMTVPPEDSPLHRVSGEAICELGADGRPAVSPDGVLPDYVRRPDAEIALHLAPAGGSSRG